MQVYLVYLVHCKILIYLHGLSVLLDHKGCLGHLRFISSLYCIETKAVDAVMR